MELESLQQIVDVGRRLPVIESNHQSERDEIGRQRIHEASTERVERHRPAERVNYTVERLLRLPYLLYSEREDLRISRWDLLPVHVRLGERATRSFGEDSDLGGDIRRRSVTAAWLPAARQTGWCGANSLHPRAFSQKRRRGKSAEHVYTSRLSFFTEPAHDLAEGSHIVAVVLHCGRRRNPQRVAAGEEIHALAAYRGAKRKIAFREVRKELTHRHRIHDGARQGVLTEGAGFVQNSDLYVAECSARLGVATNELGELDCAGKSGRTASDEQNIHRYCFGIRGIGDYELVDRQRFLMPARDNQSWLDH